MLIALKDIRLQTLVMFLASLVYSFCIGRFSVIPDHIVTIAYVLYLASFFIYVVFDSSDKNNSYCSQLCWLTVSLHAGLLIGYTLSGGGHELLWLDDAVQEHVPKSIEVKHFLQSIARPEQKLPGYYRTSHFLTGMFFLIQESPLMSGISMFIFKFLCTLGVYKLGGELFDKRTGYISALLYTLSPSIIFYTLTFYKDAAVQFWYVCFLYLFYLITIKKQYKWFPFMFIAMFILGMERNYVAVSLLPSIVIFVFIASEQKNWVKAVILSLMVVTFYFIKEKYMNFITFDTAVKTFVDYRKAYHRYSDINPAFNSELPYVLAWVKLYLTPIIAPAKFKLFFDYSMLLTWGSFVHQVTMFFFTIGAYSGFKKKFSKTFFYILPFFIFMCAFAYISSYSGRVRNSYYPMLAIYAGYGVIHHIVPYLQRKLKIQ